MSGEKMQRYVMRGRIPRPGPTGSGIAVDAVEASHAYEGETQLWYKEADVLAALASRDATIAKMEEWGIEAVGTIAKYEVRALNLAATIKTQGEEIAELRASVERLTPIVTMLADLDANPDLPFHRFHEIITGLVKDATAALAPGVKSAREVKQ